VIIDARREALALDPASARLIADRRRGVGCDQLIVLEPPRAPGAEVTMRILNPDASEAGACGNGTRCVAHLLMAETGRARTTIETIAGLLPAWREDGGTIAVDMGPARLDWRDVPLARDCDTLHVEAGAGPLADPACCSMGNPHATFFVADAEAVDLARLGPELERHAMFPQRVNAAVVQVLARDRLRFRVWERGAGITDACGSGACAAVVNAARRGLCDRRATVVLDGGELAIRWREDGHVEMAGPYSVSFSGELALE
jgi:diaminopimelate epimerase